jgi:hypothetical protein
MPRAIVILGCFVLLCLLLPLQATSSIDELGQLTEQLNAVSAPGNPAKQLTLNRGIFSAGNTSPDSAILLAKALGFYDPSTGMIQTVLTQQKSGPEELKADLDHWKQEGQLKFARAVEAPSCTEVLEQVLAQAKTEHQNDDAGFVAFLKQTKVEPEPLQLTTLDAAKLPHGQEKGALYYFAQRFYLEKGLEKLRARSAEIQRQKSGLLYGSPYAGSLESSRNWDAVVLQAWRSKAFTVPWVAERSWQNGEFSPQALGYYLALARAAESEEPIFCDLHVGSGNNPPAIRRSFYQALAQGARGIRFVGATPFVTGNVKESLPAGQFESWKTLRELTHEAGRMEPFLMQARTRAPDVGILVSLTSELWEPELWVHEERKAIYHAARLSGHNVALITEDDILEGKYRKLASIYVVGPRMRRETAQVLNRWVKAGGNIGVVGGPLRDEYDQPLTVLMDLMGITEATWKLEQQTGPAKIKLPQLPSLGNMHWSYEGLERDFPVVIGKMQVKINPAAEPAMRVYGKFADGSPAVMRRVIPVTIGHAWTFCTPLGSSWLKTVLPGRAWERGQQPNSYNHALLVRQLDGDMGDVVMAATGDARWDVITDNLAIESILLAAPRSMGVICINWSSQPQQAFLTAQFIPENLLRATSLNQGPLETKRTRATLSFKVKVPMTDFIHLEP